MGDMRVFLIYDRIAYVVGKCGKRCEREGGVAGRCGKRRVWQGGVGNGACGRAVWETARVAERR